MFFVASTWRRIALTAAAWLVTAGSPFAASLAVIPVRIQLDGAHPISALTVRNDGAEPAVVQLEAMQWTQDAGTDRYDATREILATPPIFTVPAGGRQIVRIGLRRAADPARELSYRLFLQEVPPPPPPGFNGARVVLRFGVPVFVAPGAATMPRNAAPTLQWQVHEEGGKLFLAAVNSDPAHVRISHLDVRAGTAPLFAGDVQNYLLPGQRHEWPLDGTHAAAGASVHVMAVSDAGPLDADVDVVVAP